MESPTDRSLFQQHLQPISLASIIEANGAEKALDWAKAVRKNMVRAPRGSDRDQARAVASGLADVAIMNTYYLGILANSTTEADREVARKVGVFFPNQKGRGAHVNAAGAVSPQLQKQGGAIRFLEFLTSPESQKTFGEVNYEYPVKIENNRSSLLKSWGTFKPDGVNLPSSVRGTQRRSEPLTEPDGSKPKPI